MENLPCCKSVAGYQIATNFCTCHDSTTVIPCTKFCSDHCIRIEVRVKLNFHRIWIAMEKTLVKGDSVKRINRPNPTIPSSVLCGSPRGSSRSVSADIDGIAIHTNDLASSWSLPAHREKGFISLFTRICWKFSCFPPHWYHAGRLHILCQNFMLSWYQGILWLKYISMGLE